MIAADRRSAGLAWSGDPRGKIGAPASPERQAIRALQDQVRKSENAAHADRERLLDAIALADEAIALVPRRRGRDELEAKADQLRAGAPDAEGAGGAEESTG